MSISDVLEKYIAEELAAEGITPKLLDMVDLSVAYSPVIPIRGGRLDCFSVDGELEARVRHAHNEGGFRSKTPLHGRNER